VCVNVAQFATWFKPAQRITANMARARQTAAAGIAAALPMGKCGTNLEKAKEDFMNERKSALKDSTWRKHKGVLQAFIKAKGNIDVAMVSAKTVTDYKKELLALGREATTVNDHITILNGFFEYCIDNKVANMVNPAKDLYIVGAHNKAESYEPFNEEELQTIFQSPLYVEKLKLPDFYWCPLIALFTGARAEEIASLDLEQIYPVKGIWIIDILKGKTANAKRRVPIHDQLIALGLVDYVASLRTAGYKKLFRLRRGAIRCCSRICGCSSCTGCCRPGPRPRACGRSGGGLLRNSRGGS
jgi:integrase